LSRDKGQVVGSQSNRDAWTCVTLLSKKSCVLTNSYSFWLSGKCLILIIGIRVVGYNCLVETKW